MSVKARHAEFILLSPAYPVMMITSTFSTVCQYSVFQKEVEMILVSSLSVHMCHHHALSLLSMYLFPCLHQRIWSSCIVCILHLHVLCKECKATWKRRMMSAVFRTSASRWISCQPKHRSAWSIRSCIYSSPLACSSGALVTNGRRQQNMRTFSATLQGNSYLFMVIMYPQMCH